MDKDEPEYYPPFPSHWECPNCGEETMADEVDASEWPGALICNHCDAGAVLVPQWENHDD